MSALSEAERASIEKCLATLVELGDAVGSWEDGQVTARQKSFTMTVKFDNKVDPFLADRFARTMAQCPALATAWLRRILLLDDELKSS